MAQRLLIYGAYGYTGRLIVEQARAVGLSPILAGRRAGPLVELAARSDCEHRVFALESTSSVRSQLQDCAVVLHCAGPFADTAPPMIDACLASNTHYLDVTGEIDVFEHARGRDDDARRADVVLCPGVGFDVVPTDCVAATLKNALPDAQELALGFEMDSGLSPGTAKTLLRGLPTGGRVRREGLIETVPLGWRTREIDFGRGSRTAVSIPWGDVATAFYTTGIGNITCYVPLPMARVKQLRRLNRLRWLLGRKWIQRFGARRIEQRVAGPDAAARDAGGAFVWGEARNATGDIRTARMRTANGYSVTAHAAVAVAEFVLNTPPSGGATTPAALMGAAFASALPGSSDIVIS